MTIIPPGALMRWAVGRARLYRSLGVAAALASALLTAGCFQPLYGDRSPTGGPAVRDSLSRVDVEQIVAPDGTDDARIAVQIRNELLYNFTGGGPSVGATHRLRIQITGSRSVISIDRNSAFPNMENYTLVASYSLTDLANARVVVTGQARVPVSYDPAGQQRFARVSALHDAERRAAKIISENITNRLASYFVAGG